MSNFEIRTLTLQDIPAVMALQQAYQQIYPHAVVIPGQVYLSSGFAGGENVFCAFDQEGNLQGYAPLLPALTTDPEIPHTVWIEVKVDPALLSPRSVKDSLFDRVIQRTREITRVTPARPTRLTFQYHPSEIAGIEYVSFRGCVYTESVFRMVYNLSRTLPVIAPPDKIDLRNLRMESHAEQQAYVRARNEAFPEAPITLADWQSFIGSPVWQDGICIAAFDGEEMVGSVTVYSDESLSQQLGEKAGLTEYIFVRRNWRQRGIATYLIFQGLRYLQEHGRETAHLEVRATNQKALDLYQRLGYRVVDETRLYVLEL